MKTIQFPALFALLATVAVLPGCNNQSQSIAAQEVALAEEGGARNCTASAVDPAAGANATATITVGNDGGWCGLRVSDRDGGAFAAGLVRVRPEHGRIVIEKAGSRTLVQYYPAPGYSGPDAFTAALRSRPSGTPDLTVKVNVTVTHS